MDPTPASLLEQLRNRPAAPAWDRFVLIYTPLLYLWARRLGTTGPAADDLVQDVLTTLVRTLPEFHYDPRRRFRAWLWTILANKVREGRRRTVLTRSLDEPGVSEPAVPDPADEAADREYRDVLVGRALDLIRPEFQPATWEAFWASATTDESPAEVAARLSVSVAAVYQAKSRVLRRLRQDLDGLLD